MVDFNDPNISEECLRCREKVIAKSKDATFDADCTGIFPAAYKLEQQSGKTLTDAQTKAANSLLDPIGWAAAVLDWHPRESRDGIAYQLRCLDVMLRERSHESVDVQERQTLCA